MQLGEAILTVQHEFHMARLDATHVRFSANKCFRFDGGAEDRRCLDRLAEACRAHRRLVAAVDDGGRFLGDLLSHHPDLRERSSASCSRAPSVRRPTSRSSRDCRSSRSATSIRRSQRSCSPTSGCFPDADAACVRTRIRRHRSGPARRESHRRARARMGALVSRGDLPHRRSGDRVRGRTGCAAHRLSRPQPGLMPNGLGYVHNALKHTRSGTRPSISDIVLYHRFHIRRLFDEGGVMALPNGRELPTDPWQAEHYDFWTDRGDRSVLHGRRHRRRSRRGSSRPGRRCWRCRSRVAAKTSRRSVVERVRARFPGSSCWSAGFPATAPISGFASFPQADYMCIGEADLTVGAAGRAAGRGRASRQRPRRDIPV